MRIKPVLVLGVLIILIGWSSASAQLKKVRFSTTGISISELPFKVAQVKGFWREEGLDVEAILIRGAVGMQALLGGSVDYTSASGSTIAAAVRGLPVKLVFISSAKPQFELMSQPQIKSVQDLKGKIVGISSRGGSNDLMLQIILQKNGLAPNKDVTVIIVGAQEESVIALRTGRIAAALITPPRNFMLQRDGFNRIAYSGDYMSTYANGGIGLTDEKIKTNPAEALAFVRGTLKALQYSLEKPRRDDKNHAVIFGHQRRFADRAALRSLSNPPIGGRLGGRKLDEGGHRVHSENSRRSRQGILPSQVFDFSFVQKGLR